jgi:hypothetical protein
VLVAPSGPGVPQLMPQHLQQPGANASPHQLAWYLLWRTLHPLLAQLQQQLLPVQGVERHNRLAQVLAAPSHLPQGLFCPLSGQLPSTMDRQSSWEMAQQGASSLGGVRASGQRGTSPMQAWQQWQRSLGESLSQAWQQW